MIFFRFKSLKIMNINAALHGAFFVVLSILSNPHDYVELALALGANGSRGKSYHFCGNHASGDDLGAFVSCPKRETRISRSLLSSVRVRSSSSTSYKNTLKTFLRTLIRAPYQEPYLGSCPFGAVHNTRILGK